MEIVNLIKFDQVWSSLIKFDQKRWFDQIWSSLIKFDQIWSKYIFENLFLKTIEITIYSGLMGWRVQCFFPKLMGWTLQSWF